MSGRCRAHAAARRASPRRDRPRCRRSTAAASASSASARRLLAASIALTSVMLAMSPCVGQCRRFAADGAPCKILWAASGWTRDLTVRGGCVVNVRDRSLRCSGHGVNALRAVSALPCAWRRAARASLLAPTHDAARASRSALGLSDRTLRSDRRDDSAPAARAAARPHGQRHPRARHGRGRAGEIRPSRPADGRRRYRDRAVHAVPQIRSADPAWPDRDRFVLSAGHGSMLLYSLLHLLGYEDDDDRGDQALPPARLDHAGPSGELHHARASRPRPARSARGSATRSAWRSPSASGGAVRRATSSITAPTCSPPTAT